MPSEAGEEEEKEKEKMKEGVKRGLFSHWNGPKEAVLGTRTISPIIYNSTM